MILDFNSPNCKFKPSDLSEYDVNAIFDNIDRFKKFAGETVISHDFDKVFRTNLFQVTLCDKNTADTDSVLAVYNTIASKMLKIPLPEITHSQLKHELKIRGYETKRMSKKNNDGTYDKFSIFYKPHRYD